MEHNNFPKFEKKFYQKTAIAGVNKIMRTIELNLATMRQLIIKALEEVPRTLVPEKRWCQKTFQKLKTFFKKLPILKSWKTFHDIQKLCSNLKSNPKGSGGWVNLKNEKRN